MAEFLAENNPCGQNILNIVSRGNAIIAELLRLKDYIPPVFKLETKHDQQKYGDIICDFSYFKNSDEFDRKIDSNPQLQDLDEEFRENYIEILTRFYLAFESIHKYVSDLNHFIYDLEEGVYIQQNLENVLLSEDGKQLLCEALYLYGVMLLVVDGHVFGNGAVRERLVVSHLRYSTRRSSADSNADDVCKLLRSTGLISGSKRPLNYPEDYFKRIPVNETFIEMILGRLRSDDVYSQVSAYPLPEHRSVALSSQAAMLYVCLYFSPETLHSQTAKMREIVDKFFPDNWVISIYMGITVNLVEAWDPYKAAKQALSNTVQASNIHECSLKHGSIVKKLIPQTQKVLKEGALTEDSLLDHQTKVIGLVRECNVTLRWLMLHSASLTSVAEGHKRCKQIRDQVLADTHHDPLRIFELLLNTAQLELKVKEMLKQLLAEKQQRWENYKKESVERMQELSDVFSGAKPLTRVEKNENLRAWFQEMGKHVNSLNHEDSMAAGRKIVQLIQALEEVQEFHHLESNLQVRQFLADTRDFLHCMMRTANIREGALVTVQVVGDLSYAWGLMDAYTPCMQMGIRKNPALVAKLRATFLKLSSALEIPLLRINQAHSSDLVSVSAYYSGELVAYVRAVLQVIPEMTFALLARVIHLQTTILKELPTRLDKNLLREYAQLDERHEVAKLTHAVSVFTEGILAMKSTLVGIVRVDPKQLLEDGIRMELVKHVAEALHTGLTFDSKSKTSDLVPKLKALGVAMDAHKRSFEYMGDYAGVSCGGLQIWQEELSRIVGFCVEQECANFAQRGGSGNRAPWEEWKSVHQSRTMPVPTFPPTDAHSVNFIGRLAREIIRITDPKTTVYVEHMSAWFELRTRKEIIDLNFFSLVTQSIGVAGLTGLDRFFSFIIVSKLQNLLSDLEKGILRDKTWLAMFESVSKDLGDTMKSILTPGRTYTNFCNRAERLWPSMLDKLLAVGQLQLLRMHAAYQLSTHCAADSQQLFSALHTMNEALIADIKAHYKDPTNKPYPKDDNPLLYELSLYLDWAGLGDPMAKIYVTTRNLQHISLLSFLFLAHCLPKLQYVKNAGGLMCRKSSDPLDGVPLVVGLQTLLRQFHPEVKQKFLAYIGQYIRSHLLATSGPVPTISSSGGTFSSGKWSSNWTSVENAPSEVITMLVFLDCFARQARLPKESILAHIPHPILDHFNSLISTSSQGS
ncbi:WASH complex subunit 5 isoform X2 [Hetaerina americana]|uniref:WASH complex subunit 5 isoform X2 n=1 Tax=Hetaerina americana TaxID=62018 RepID=UPI003A7F2C95